MPHPRSSPTPITPRSASTRPRDLSLRIGPDASVIGHHDLPTSELLNPPLATIRLDGREMGRALMARLLGGDLHGDYVAPVELVERASLQAPRLPVNPCSPRSVRQLGNEP
jgi:DNA-binding LacI/PurR family transcriptional regulator